METLRLTRVGEAMSGNLYKDEKGRYYVDQYQSPVPDTPSVVYRLSPPMEPDGEPDFPITCNIEILNPFTEREKRERLFRHDYMMLSAIQTNSHSLKTVCVTTYDKNILNLTPKISSIMTNVLFGSRNSAPVASMPIVTETTKVDNTKFFDWNEKGYGTQPLTLEMLERTQHENDVQGKPLKGIYHFQLINDILSACNEFGYQTEVYDLFAAQNRDKNMPGVTVIRQVEEKYGDNAVEAHILRRVFANIRIKDFDNAETTTGLAIAYHQKGIQVGFGPQVIICHNQCMLSPELYIASYGDKGTGRGGGSDIETIIRTVRGWLMDARNLIETDRRKIEQLKNIVVTPDQMLMIIGQLTAMRVKADTSRKTIRANMTYPLNQSQITTFTEDMLEAYELHDRVTAWDIYNSATEMYKADRMDIPQLLPQNRAMVAFLNDWFNVA